MRSSTDRLAARSAFTLIELLVVISIIVVFAAGMMPTFLKSSDRFRLKDSTRRLSDLMSFCHSMAVFESTTFRLDVDVEGGRCRVLFEEDPVGKPGQFRPFRMSGYTGYELQPGVTFRDLSIAEHWAGEFGDEDYIEFRPDGTADEAAVVLANEDEECFTVMLSPLTSQVRIVEHDVSEETGDSELGTRNGERGTGDVGY